MRVVLDTSILIAVLIAGKLPRLKQEIIYQRATIVISDVLLKEVLQVIKRPKFRNIIHEEDIKELLTLLEEGSVMVYPTRKVEDCRDPKDNIVLECALEGRADNIITLDKDLLILNPYKGIKIQKSL